MICVNLNIQCRYRVIRWLRNALLNYMSDKDMRVLHVLAFAERGGCEKNCFLLIKATPEYRHDVIVLNGNGPMVDEWRSLDVDVVVWRVGHLNLLSFYKELKSRMPCGEYEKVIVWTTIRMPVILYAFNKFNNIDIYVHVGNPVSRSCVSDFKNILLDKLFPFKNRVFLRTVSAFVQSSVLKSRYYREFSSKVSLKPIVRTGLSAKEPQIISRDESVNVGMVARLDPIKDHATVIKAFYLIVQQYPLSVLHFVGDGVMRSSLLRLVEEMKLQKQVIFHGNMQDVYQQLTSWDLFLYATTYEEGLGGTVPEALSVGVPVVAVDLPMIREWDRSAEFVVYSKPFDHCDMACKAIELLSDVERRKYIYINARNYIREKFSPETFAHNYISID